MLASAGNGASLLLSLVVVALGAVAVGVGLTIPAAAEPAGEAKDLELWVRLGIVVVVAAAAQLARLRVRLRAGRVNVAWGEAALVVGLFLVPTPWLPATIVVGVTAAVLLLRLRGENRTVVQTLHAAGSFAIATGVAAVVATAVQGERPYGLKIEPGYALALGLASLVYLVVTVGLVAVTMCLRYGGPVWPVLRQTVEAKALMFVGNLVAGLVAITMIQVDLGWLVALPLGLWLLQRTYAQHLRANGERDTWQTFADITRSLNQLDEAGVAAAGAQGAVALFGARAAQVEVFRGDGTHHWYTATGTAAAVVSPVEPPGNGAAGEELPLIVGGVSLGTLRVWCPAPAELGPRDRTALAAFSDALGAALHDAATQHELEAVNLRSSHAAKHDPLTRLLNRRAMLLDGDAQLRGLDRDQPVALLLLDVNHFKEVNDTLGHSAGDELLGITADRLRERAEPGELLGRLGGDEFALLVTALPPVADQSPPAVGQPAPVADQSPPVADQSPPVADQSPPVADQSPPVADQSPPVAATPAAVTQVRDRARALAEALAVPTVVAGVHLSVEASVGVVMARAGSTDMIELLRRADVAMYQAKQGGGNIAWYDAGRDAASTDRLALIAEMREALRAEDQLILELQPAIDLATGGPTSVEGLVRWRHPRRGRLKPAEFVRAVEGSELLTPFTLYVLDRALAAAVTWAEEGLDIPVAVNLSARNLLDPTLPAKVAERLREHGVPASRLVLEITETVVMSELRVIDDVLAGLRALGVRLAVDDFGTGYSSLTFLTRIQVDELKIDRTFVGRMAESAQAAAIVRTVVALGRELGLRVVAEGVETAEQRALLTTMGCPAAQGYHFLRPVTADKITSILHGLVDGAQTNVIPLRADDAAS